MDDLERRNSPYRHVISRKSVASGADYVKVVENTLIRERYPTTNGWLKDQEQQFSHNGIRALEKPCTKCISVAGEYDCRKVTKYDVRIA